MYMGFLFGVAKMFRCNKDPRTSLDQKDTLEKEMATTHSSLAWEILWTEEPGGLLSIGSHRVGHD